MSAALTARIAEEFAQLAREPAAAARTALAALSAQGLPTSRDENWKYANLRPLERVKFAPAAAGPTPTAAQLPAAVPGFTRYVFVDGLFAAQLSAAITGNDPVVRLGALTHEPHAPGIAAADERFALLNEAFASDGAVIRVAAREHEAPVRLEVVFVAQADAQIGASYPHLDVRLEAHAQLELIERHVSVGTQASFVNGAVRARIGRGALFKHYRLQELGARVLAFDTLSAQLAADARYRLHAISTGAQSARSTVTVRLTGERAEVTLGALSLGERSQVQDSFALIEHAAPHARTEQVFRGIAAGRARVAFNGKIVVAAGAHGTDSRQSLRGLLAGPEAEIDVRPQLEIYTDDVRCSHGATAGKLDDHMLFYLLSRGLEPQVAQNLLKWAFLEDVVATIDVPELRRQIETRLAAQVPDAPPRPEDA